MAAVSGEVWLGLGVAVASAGCFETSYAVQALEARAEGGGPRASLLLRMVRRPRWAAAIALAIVGFALEIVALGLAPLTLVQPVVASGLLLLFYLGVRVLGEQVRRRDIAAALAIVVGIAGIAASAPQRSGSVSRSLALTLVLAGLVLVALAPYVLGRLGRRGAFLVASAGAADAVAVLAAKLVSNELSDGRPLAAAAFLAGAGATILLGLTSETAALQRLPATRVAPLVLVIQTAVPVVLAPVLLGEDWGSTPLGGVLIAGSLALLGMGAVALATSTAIGVFRAPVEAVEHHGGGGGQLGE
jgi:drug/metabolite transporter (DMT)-like permease